MAEQVNRLYDSFKVPKNAAAIPTPSTSAAVPAAPLPAFKPRVVKSTGKWRMLCWVGSQVAELVLRLATSSAPVDLTFSPQLARQAERVQDFSKPRQSRARRQACQVGRPCASAGNQLRRGGRPAGSRLQAEQPLPLGYFQSVQTSFSGDCSAAFASGRRTEPASWLGTRCSALGAPNSDPRQSRAP